MNKMRFCVLSFSVAIIIGVSTGVYAELVISNLNETPTGAYAIISPFGGSPEGDAWAQAFTTPSSGPGWVLDSLTLTLREAGDAPGDLTVGLYSDTSGTPGTLLVALTGPNPTGGALQQLSYTPGSSFTLAPNSTYFAVLTATTSPGNFYEWQLMSSTGETGESGWSIADGSRSNPSGAIWVDHSPLAIGVNATVVPEPSTAAMTLLGLIGTMLASRRRAD